MSIRMILLLIIILPFSAPADDYDDFNSDGHSYNDFNSTKSFKYNDWSNLQARLKADGIILNENEWQILSASCQDKQKSPDYLYNKCRFKNAKSYFEFTKDKKYCSSVAKQKYFEYIRSQPCETAVYGKNSHTPLDESERFEFEESYKTVCMRNLGWKDAESWVSGKL